jgi:uncharacterized protein (UPF0261 family)
MRKIAVVATLDTKGPEAAFLRDCIQDTGHQTLVVDTGMLFDPLFEADISRSNVLAAIGIGNIEELRREGKSALTKVMTDALVTTLTRLYAENKISGVISLGGAQGTAVSTAAMRMLPIGFPKVMVSTIACGRTPFGPYVGTRDITMIHSVADVCGLNSVTIPVFSNAAGAVVGMVEAAERTKHEAGRFVTALTMAGVTTACVMSVKEQLDNLGMETIVFHCNGVGSVVIDEMAREGRLDGVIDITPHEVTDLLYDGEQKGDENRFSNVYKSGIPVLMIPGGMDVILQGPIESVRQDLADRVAFQHTLFHTHIRTTREEMYNVGSYTAERLNGCGDKALVMIPLKGFSQQNAEGKPLYDEDANMGFVQAMRETLTPQVRCIEKNMHINDPAFADEIVRAFLPHSGYSGS